MKITIEICCDETFGERRGDKMATALGVLRKAVEEAEENIGELSDPHGVERQSIYGPDGSICGDIRVDG